MAPDRSPLSLRERVAAREPLLGVILRMPNLELTELAGLVGLDFVVIDTEHGPGDQIPLLHHILAARAGGIGVLVRIGGVAEVQRVLDLGVDGIVAPHVSDAERAERLVRAAHLPPRGDRGFAGYTRSGGFGLEPVVDQIDRSAAALVIAMVEDEAGVARAAAIAGTDGIDGLLLGPSDLAVDLGVPGRTDDPRIFAARVAVHAAAGAAGGVTAVVVSDRVGAEAAFAAGADLVICNVAQLLAAVLTDVAQARPVGPAAMATAAALDTEPLVLLSGMLGGEATWEGVAADLSGRGTVRTLQPARIDLDDTVPAMARRVLMEAPARFALAGHSLGAIVALEIVRQAPDRVSRLALLNAGGRGPSAVQLGAWVQWQRRVEDGEFAAVAAELARSNLPAGRRQDEELVGRIEAIAATVGAAGFSRQLAAQASRPDSRDRLDEIDVPVLVVSGELDEVAPPYLQEELVAGIRGAVHVVLQGVGHLAPMEAPGQVAAHLRRWLER